MRAVSSLLFSIWISGSCLTASVLSIFCWFIDNLLGGKNLTSEISVQMKCMELRAIILTINNYPLQK